MRFLFIALLLVFLSMPVNMPAHAQGGPPSVTPVIVAEVGRVDFADEIEALGTLRANETVDLASSVTELVTEVLFEDNQRVQKGDVLVVMDAAEEFAELEEQKSFLDEAQRQVDRLSPLVKKGAASASVLDENEREADAAQARVNAIQSRIDQRIIKAPFDGVLGLRNISVGALAQPGSMITTIDDDSVMKLDFSVPEVFLSTLNPGVMIEARTEAYPEEIFKGKISSVDSRIDPVTRSIQARAVIDNPNGKLKPGLLMRVVLQKNPRKALVVPEEALIANGPDNFVLVIEEEDGKTIAQRKKVTLGERQFGIAEVLSGLEAGDRVISHGILRVMPGSEVKITAVEEGNESLSDLLNKGENKGGEKSGNESESE